MTDRAFSAAALALAYTLVCVVWGSTYLFIKIGVEAIPPYLLGGVRFSIAGAALTALCLATGRRLPADVGTFARAALVGILLLVIGNGLLNVSETSLDSGLAALLVTTFPIWTTLLARAGRRAERLAPVGWAGLVVSLAGVAILVRPFGSGVESSWGGVAAVLVASMTWAVGTVYARRALGDRSLRRERRGDPGRRAPHAGRPPRDRARPAGGVERRRLARGRLPRRHGVARRVHRLRLPDRARLEQQGGDVRVREPRGRRAPGMVGPGRGGDRAAGDRGRYDPGGAAARLRRAGAGATAGEAPAEAVPAAPHEP